MQANSIGTRNCCSLPRIINRCAVVFALCAAGMQAHATYTPPPPCAKPFTPQHEVTEGSKVAAQVYQQMPVLPESDPVSQYVAQLGAHLATSLEELQQIYDQRSHIPARFRDLSWSSWFRINSRMIDRLRVGRVFHGGDSAHIHSPAGAQGMNTGIQDTINLGWKLALVI